jgi:hypothetical protein
MSINEVVPSGLPRMTKLALLRSQGPDPDCPYVEASCV